MFIRVVFLFLSILTLQSCKKSNEYISINGYALGTSLSIIYKETNKKDYSKSIDSLFNVVNQSLSTYHPTSLISTINQVDSIKILDHHFITVFNQAKEVYNETNGLFDPTVGALVNAWGFGPEEEIKNLDSIQVKDLMQYVGFNKVKLLGNILYKEHPAIYLDFNAIAKGYAVDLIGVFLEKKNIHNYMIEIGGEVRVRGVNRKGELWKIGIEKPLVYSTRTIETILLLDNKSIATSGNYRKFKTDGQGKKFVHTINPKNGFPIENDLLSATVISSLDCSYVDAYATAFMVMGFEKTKEFIEDRNDLQVFLIYVNEHDKTVVFENIP